MKRGFVLGLFVFGVATMAIAEDFWVKKEYTQWTDDEVRKMLKDSPWAKDVMINAQSMIPSGRAENSGGPGNSGFDVENSAGGSRGGRGGRTGGDSGGSGESLVSLNISWRSALPLKKALAKMRLASEGSVPADLEKLLSTEDTSYVIVLSGLPPSMARAMQNPEQLKESVLRPGKRVPISLAGYQLTPRGKVVDIVFVFPKTMRIAEDDKEVEVELKLGAIKLKRKFNLKEMMYSGKLEL